MWILVKGGRWKCGQAGKIRGSDTVALCSKLEGAFLQSFSRINFIFHRSNYFVCLCCAPGCITVTTEKIKIIVKSCVNVRQRPKDYYFIKHWRNNDRC